MDVRFVKNSKDKIIYTEYLNELKVRIFEATNRIGGRVYTKKLWNSDIELGAWQFPTSHKLINILINHTKLPTREMLQDQEDNFFHINGKLIKLKDIFYEKSIYSKLFMDGSKIVKNILDPLFDEILAKGWKQFIKEYDQYTVEDIFLRKITMKTFNHLKKIMWLNTFSDRSIVQYLRTYSLRQNAMKYLQIIGGNKRLTDYLADELEGNIYLGTAVVGVEKFKDKFIVTSRYCDEFKNCRKMHFQADHVILTVPATVLKYIKFDKKLYEEIEPVKSLSYVKEARIAVKCKSPIWHDLNIQGGLSRLENFVFVIYPSDKTTKEFYIKKLYYGDDFDKKKFVEESFRELSEIHGKYFSSNCTKYALHIWENEYYQKSAFSLFKPGQEVIQKYILSMNDNIWISGEHTTEIRGWVEGALISGLRIAKQILDKQI